MWTMQAVELFRFGADAGPAAGGTGGMLIQLIPFLAIFAIFYFLLIMPMRKRQKKHLEMVSKLVKGDRVITSGGLFGTVISTEEDRIVVRIAEPKVDVQIARSAVAGLAKDAATVNLTPAE